jgi:hypothetical protein
MARTKRAVSKEISTILYNHYLWCKKEGRDISWYDNRSEQSKRNK